jgi:hypothetical protein
MRAGDKHGLVPRSRFVVLELILKSFAEQHVRTPMAGKGKRSKQRKKLVKKLAKKVIKKAKKAEKKSNSEVDRSDVKPPSPFSS